MAIYGVTTFSSQLQTEILLPTKTEVHSIFGRGGLFNRYDKYRYLILHCKNRKEWFKEFVERVLTIHSSDILLILSNCAHKSDTGFGSQTTQIVLISRCYFAWDG